MKVLRDAGREALKVVEEDMKQHAGFDDASSAEHMRDSIKIRSSTRKVAEIRWSSFGLAPAKALHESAGPEFGTVKQVANPFIRPALDYNVQQILRILTVEIRNGIQNR